MLSFVLISLTFAKVYVLIVGLDYKPALKPFVKQELKLISQNLGNYTLLTPQKFKTITFSKKDTLIVLGEYYGFKLYPKGSLNWLILDYCYSCRSIDIDRVKASHILCTESKIPAYGFYFVYTLKKFSPKAIKVKLLQTLKWFRYRGELGSIKVKLYNK